MVLFITLIPQLAGTDHQASSRIFNASEGTERQRGPAHFLGVVENSVHHIITVRSGRGRCSLLRRSLVRIRHRPENTKVEESSKVQKPYSIKIK
ncbi:hypothetical protein L596_025152 [Steinernema carpocapsae]|uniref:Uncharacterized protein n=1 Tax=Steinernema carpocapsae TaxID=34508 RepID=A0A4U5M6Y8_STECR|nr:hypothetical protein L596_025152 [Steinernema carpocapsae]